jgi:hypothetical protein
MFTLAHNTLFLEGGRLELRAEDLYGATNPSTIVTIEFEAVCSCTTSQPFDERCYHCSTLVKTLKKDYTELKQTISVLHIRQFRNSYGIMIASWPACFASAERSSTMLATTNDLVLRIIL